MMIRLLMSSFRIAGCCARTNPEKKKLEIKIESFFMEELLIVEEIRIRDSCPGEQKGDPTLNIDFKITIYP